MVKGIFVSAVLGLGVLALPSVSTAQGGTGTGSMRIQIGDATFQEANFQMRQNPQEMLFKGIELSAEQKAKIDSINAKYKAKADSMRKANPEAGKKMRDSAMRDKKHHAGMRGMMSPFSKEREAEVLAVLTDEQKETYNKNKAEMEKRMKEGMRDGKNIKIDGSNIKIEGMELKTQ